MNLTLGDCLQVLVPVFPMFARYLDVSTTPLAIDLVEEHALCKIYSNFAIVESNVSLPRSNENCVLEGTLNELVKKIDQTIKMTQTPGLLAKIGFRKSPKVAYYITDDPHDKPFLKPYHPTMKKKPTFMVVFLKKGEEEKGVTSGEIVFYKRVDKGGYEELFQVNCQWKDEQSEGVVDGWGEGECVTVEWEDFEQGYHELYRRSQ